MADVNAPRPRSRKPRSNGQSRARSNAPRRIGPGRFLGQWAPLVVLAVFSMVAWRTADAAARSASDSEPIAFTHELATPLFSARRAPETLRAPIADAELVPELDAIESASPDTTCLMVLSEDRTVEEHQPDLALVPASNQKIVTTYAALGLLGPEYRFRTIAVAAAPPVGGVLSGDLFFVGGGDPYVATDDWWAQYDSTAGRAHTRLEELADGLVAVGVTEITGSVVGDESRYDTIRTGPWAQRLVDSRQSGPLSALAVNQNFTSWPAEFAGSFRPRVPAEDPPTAAAATLARLLTERGVTIAGEPRAGQAPAEVVELAGLDSPPLAELITHVNSYSDNFGAELLVKEIGLRENGTGSTVAGTDAITSYLSSLGFPLGGVQILDGSGLAESNRSTCRLLAQLIRSTGANSALVESFSIGGVRGSLIGRYTGTVAQGRVFAKTGTLNDVTALSGVVYPVDEPDLELTFSYIVNGELAGQSEEIRDLQNPLVEQLATYPVAPDLDQLAPLPPIELSATSAGASDEADTTEDPGEESGGG